MLWSSGRFCSAEKLALRTESSPRPLAKHPEKLKRSRCLYGMVNSLLREEVGNDGKTRANWRAC